MPTNILRSASRKQQPNAPEPSPAGAHEVLISAGRVSLRATLASTTTAARIWAALPLHTRAETWGDSLHFAVPIESGRERGARMLGQIGEIYYWAEEDRILIVFGPTPISRPGEIRLPRPCNVLAHTSDDVCALRTVTPGEKVSIIRAPAA
jgi:hypothetical protein